MQNNKKNRGNATKTVIVHNNYGSNHPVRRNSYQPAQRYATYPNRRREPSKGEIAVGAFTCILGAFALCSKVLDMKK